MELIESKDFLKSLNDLGIGFDPRYPHSGCLSLLPPNDHSRFWVLPQDPHVWNHFATSLIESLDDWNFGYLWPRNGSWPDWNRSENHNEKVRDLILQGVGIPSGWAGSVRFFRNELSSLIGVLYAYLAFGWCSEDDLFFIPNHGHQLLQTDHHDVVHVGCKSEERISDLISHMSRSGYELPTELPDETFKWPSWMSKKNDTPD
jgi:hypothetical protein